MKYRLTFFTLSALLSPTIALTDPIRPVDGCRTNPSVVAPCFSLHGRMSASNGTPSLRIWQTGTNRLLGVVPSENEIVPENIKGKATFKQNVFANFEVCPFTDSHSGEMQLVCVESATDVKIQSTINSKHNYKPPQGYVPDAETAIKIAVAIWEPIYGEGQIAQEKPYTAVLLNGIWTVQGSLPKEMRGGVAIAEIAKIDGRIIRVSHGK